MRNTGFIILSLFIFGLGCNLYAPETRHATPSNMPSNFSMYSEKNDPEKGRWWEDFESSELNILVGQALGSNFDLREAYARIKQSRARVAKASSFFYPEVSGTAGASHNRSGSRDNSGNDESTNSYSIGLAASYEIDLWGRIRSEKEAEVLYLDADSADYDAAAMTIVAGVVETWADIIAIRQEMEYVNVRIETNARILKMMELRFKKSMATALDVLHQRAVLEGSRAMLPKLQAKEGVYLNELVFLLGAPIGLPVELEQEVLPGVSQIPDAGLPVDLLAMRPDIRSVGLKLKAADWEIASAKAARLPALSLSASGAYSADQIDDIFRNWIANLAGNLTGPIFDAGRRKSEVDRVTAIAEERLARYENVVFSAIKEVENALINEDKQGVFIQKLENELSASQLSLEEAKKRYMAGQLSFITTQERLLEVQNLNAELIREKANRVKYRIALYRALGGNWTAVPKG